MPRRARNNNTNSNSNSNNNNQFSPKSVLNKKPITPTHEEINQNPRSRSAKLRVIERIK